MVQKAGFETSIVHGYAKGKSKYAIGPQGIFTRHAWNAGVSCFFIFPSVGQLQGVTF
jgi:hypothetical protein